MILEGFSILQPRGLWAVNLLHYPISVAVFFLVFVWVCRKILLVYHKIFLIVNENCDTLF